MWISDLLTTLIQQKVGFRKLSALEKAQQFPMNNNKSKLWGSNGDLIHIILFIPKFSTWLKY